MYTLKRLRGQELATFAPLTFPSLRPILTQQDLQPTLVGIGATLLGSPIGFALAGLPSLKTAVIHSIVVAPEHRGVGVGTALLARLGHELLADGCASAAITYLSDGPYTVSLERVLEKNHWSAPNPYMVVGRTDYEKISKAPWVKQWNEWRHPPEFQVFLWSQITTSERTQILERQSQQAWFPECLNPFSREARIEPRASLGLKYKGQISGWCLAYRTVGDSLSPCFFVEKRLEVLGLGFALLSQSINLAGQIRMHKFTFDISLETPGMLQFVQRRLLPYVEALRTINHARKWLAAWSPSEDTRVTKM